MRLRNVPGAREVMIENEYVFTYSFSIITSLAPGTFLSLIHYSYLIY